MFRFIVVLSSMLIAPAAFAQQWGTGMWGGMQGCSQQRTAGAGAESQLDGIKEAQEALNKAQRSLREKKTALKKAEKDLEKVRETVLKTIDDSFADTLFAHIDNRRACDEYKQSDSSCKSDSCLSPYRRDEWEPICDGGRVGRVNARAACGLARSRASDRDRRDAGGCTEALGKYSKVSGDVAKLQREVEKLEAEVENQKDNIKTAKENAIEDLKNKQAEGGLCVECMMNQRGQGAPQKNTDWASVVGNVGTGLLATYMGYQTNKMVTQANTSLGWPTQSYPAWGYGMPYFANGIYGALGGGTGQGSFGCGGGMNGMNNMAGMNGMNGMMNGGVFGYPQNMMSAMSGGMYLGGMSPWGMNGPNGMGLSGMNAGMMMNGGLMSSGMMATSGYMMPGMMSSGMMATSGYMMPGMMSSGLMMSGMSGQFQTQMMQMQQQQYQLYAQMQQAQYQQSMQRQQASTQLQSEIYSLMTRLQQVQYGGTYNYGLTGTYGLGGTSYLGSTGILSTGYVTPGLTTTTTTSGR